MRLHIAGFALLFVITHTCLAQNIDSIRYVLDSAYAKAPFFANVLITEKGKTILEQSYGYADAMQKKPLTAQNSFQVASISKQFTAYGIMLLKNKGLLHYDSLVMKYIPGFPYNNITVRHMLTHTSGLPDFWDGIRPNLDTSRSNGNKDVLQYLQQHQLPLQFVPGSKFDYSDIGYDFLANIIENVSGLSYEDFMQKNIFKPLKMEHTFAYMVTDISRIKNENLAIGHLFKDSGFVYAHLQPACHFVFYLGDFYGDGSVVTTARDLSVWDKALKSCTLLPCAAQQQAETAATCNGQTILARSSPDVGYGFGWFIRDTSPQGRMIYHTGAHPGNVHVIYRLPDKDIAFILLSNAETPGLRALRSRILQLL